MPRLRAARRLLVFAAGLVVLFASGAASQTPNRVPNRRSGSLDGRVLFERHCVACHGPQGRGDGRAALVFAAPIPDLTRICAREGWFDALHVKGHLAAPRADGREAMPDWPLLFRSAYGPARAEIALVNLARYVGTLQIEP